MDDDYAKQRERNLAGPTGAGDGIGTVRVFNNGFCCVRVRGIGLRLLYGARFSTGIYTRACHWIPRMFA
jgi:hypothetical protein